MLGPDHDLARNAKLRHQLVARCRGREFGALLMACPGSSFSHPWEHATIKRPDLRSRTQQDGIQGLEERWKRKVDDHNMLFALKRDLCYAMHEAGRPFVRESPWAPPDEQLFPAQLFVADHYITVAMCKALNA